ncbi:MAG: universal stress protein, partial [Halobacteriaceae archaeon]
RVVREAGELAAGVDAELTLLHVTSQEEYNDKRAAMERVPSENVSYTVGQALEGARQFARDVGGEVLDGIDVEYETVGAVGDAVEEIINQANQRDCDHIFIAGRKRSPTGKAIFGDVAQEVILDFDGAVTVITE